MLQLLKADLYRIEKEHNLLWPAIILFFVAGFLSNISFEESWHELVMGMTVIEPYVIVPCLIHSFYFIWVQDFKSRSVNNLIVSGVSRTKYFNSKILLSLLVALYYFVVLWVVFLMGVFGKYVILDNFWQALGLIVARIPFYLTLVVLGSLLYITMKNEHVATIIYLLWMFLGENLMSLLIEQINPNWLFIENYYIYNNLSLISYPEFWQDGHVLSAYCSCLVIGLIAYVVAQNYFKKKELA